MMVVTPIVLSCMATMHYSTVSTQLQLGNNDIGGLLNRLILAWAQHALAQCSQ